MTHLTVITK